MAIPWTAKITRKILEPDVSMDGNSAILRLTYFRQIMRSNSMEKAVMPE